MKQYKLIIAWSGCALLLALAFASSVTAQAKDETIVIGVSTPLSGALAANGLDIRDALNFANERYFGGKYKFVFEDDQCDKRVSLTVANKLISIDKVHYVLGTFCNAVLLTTAPVYTRAGVTVIADGATSGDTKNIGPGMFRLYPADHFGARILYSYAVKRHKHLGVITEVDEFSQMMERTILRENSANPQKIKLSVEQVMPPDRDFRTMLLRLKKAGIDSIFLNAMSEGGYAEMVKQAVAINLKVPMYAYYMPSSDAARQLMGTLDSGVKFSALPLLNDLTTPEGLKVYAAYKEKYGEPRAQAINVLNGIDSLRLLDAALHSGQPVNKYLSQVKFKGLTGEISFDSDGAIQGIHFEMQEIVDGHVKRVSDQ